MAKAAVLHVPAMQERARGQGRVPGERRQATGNTIGVNQLEKLLGELLRLRSRGRWPIGSGQPAVCCRDTRRIATKCHALRGRWPGPGARTRCWRHLLARNRHDRHRGRSRDKSLPRVAMTEGTIGEAI